LTLVLPRSPLVPDEVTAGLDTVAVRVPAHPVAHALLVAAGIPVAAPSANLFSRPSPTRAGHVLDDLDGRIDLIVDGGPTTHGVESTVLDLSTDTPIVLRPGAITIEMLREVVPRVEARTQRPDEDARMPSPGLLSKHYAPRAPLTLYEGEPHAMLERLTRDSREALSAGARVGLIVADEDAVDVRGVTHVARLGSADDLATVASRLYAALREMDAAGVDVILARGFPGEIGLAVAVRDRLHRAATKRIVV